MNRILKICLVVAGVAAAAVFLFKLPIKSVILYGFLLACPLMHLFMGHEGHKINNSKHDH